MVNLMKISNMKLTALGLLLLAVGGIASFSRVNSQAQEAPSQSGAVGVAEEIAAYRSWTKVNEAPHKANNFRIDGQDS